MMLRTLNRWSERSDVQGARMYRLPEQYLSFYSILYCSPEMSTCVVIAAV
jgi:hypothetical protein